MCVLERRGEERRPPGLQAGDEGLLGMSHCALS